VALPNVLTIEEISEQLRVPEAAIQQEINNGRLAAVSIAGHVRIFWNQTLTSTWARSAKARTLVLR
jgi:excisionase family DNA binding protein